MKKMNRKLLSALVVACLVAPFSMTFAADPATREVVSFRKFKETFPDKLGDLVKTNASGQTSTVGDMTTSTATGTYAKDKDGAEPNVELTIMDYNNPQMVAGIAVWATMNISTETDDEYSKTMKIGDSPAMVQFNFKDKSGSYTILVAGRFLVTAHATNIKEEDFKKIPEQLPIKAIADLAK